jgi:hypothetical protein
MKEDRKLSRRDFLRRAPLAAAGLAAGSSMGISHLTRDAWARDTTTGMPFEAPRILDYRPLGKTGLKFSDISMGAAVDDGVIKYAVDRGINFFDTADSYYIGQGEEALGRALRGVRDKCFVATKHMVEAGWKRETLIEKVNASLRRLDSDYVDMLFMQGVADPAMFKNEEILAAYDKLKEQGKYRFLCFSTHDTDTVVPAAIESGLFSAAMLMYIPGMFAKMEEMHARQVARGRPRNNCHEGAEGRRAGECAREGRSRHDIRAGLDTMGSSGQETRHGADQHAYV